jgi:hypothetical protein
VVSAGREKAQIREIEILSNKKSSLLLRRGPDAWVSCPAQTLLKCGADLVSQGCNTGGQCGSRFSSTFIFIRGGELPGQGGPPRPRPPRMRWPP